MQGKFQPTYFNEIGVAIMFFLWGKKQKLPKISILLNISQ